MISVVGEFIVALLPCAGGNGDNTMHMLKGMLRAPYHMLKIFLALEPSLSP